MPTKRCSWGTCNSDSRYAHRDHMKGVFFVPFPKPTRGQYELERCKEWIRLCNRPHNQLNVENINRYRYVCSKHFEDGLTYPVLAAPSTASKRGGYRRRKPPSIRLPPAVVEEKSESHDDESDNESDQLEPIPIVKRCYYGKCSNSSAKMTSFTFRRFPQPDTERERCLKWIHACNSSYSRIHIDMVTPERYVCSKHFKDGCEDPEPAPQADTIKLEAETPTQHIISLTGKKVFPGSHMDTVHDRNASLGSPSMPNWNILLGGDSMSEKSHNLYPKLTVSLDVDQRQLKNCHNLHSNLKSDLAEHYNLCPPHLNSAFDAKLLNRISNAEAGETARPDKVFVNLASSTLSDNICGPRLLPILTSETPNLKINPKARLSKRKSTPYKHGHTASLAKGESLKTAEINKRLKVENEYCRAMSNVYPDVSQDTREEGRALVTEKIANFSRNNLTNVNKKGRELMCEILPENIKQEIDDDEDVSGNEIMYSSIEENRASLCEILRGDIKQEVDNEEMSEMQNLYSNRCTNIEESRSSMCEILREDIKQEVDDEEISESDNLTQMAKQDDKLNSTNVEQSKTLECVMFPKDIYDGQISEIENKNMYTDLKDSTRASMCEILREDIKQEVDDSCSDDASTESGSEVCPEDIGEEVGDGSISENEEMLQEVKQGVPLYGTTSIHDEEESLTIKIPKPDLSLSLQKFETTYIHKDNVANKTKLHDLKLGTKQFEMANLHGENLTNKTLKPNLTIDRQHGQQLGNEVHLKDGKLRIDLILDAQQQIKVSTAEWTQDAVTHTMEHNTRTEDFVPTDIQGTHSLSVQEDNSKIDDHTDNLQEKASSAVIAKLKKKLARSDSDETLTS